MAYQETIDAFIRHHRSIADKMERNRSIKVNPELEKKFDLAQELIRRYEFRLVPKADKP